MTDHPRDDHPDDDHPDDDHPVDDHHTRRPPLVDARAAAGIGAEKPGQLASRTIHDGTIVRLSIDTVRFPDGSTGELELVRHSGAAAVVPVLGRPDDPDPDIVLVRQFRYAAGGDILEIPAGRPDRHGEPWEDVARRELEEETGYVAENLRPLTSIYTTPGFTDERIHLFLASDLSRGQTNLDHDEFVEVLATPLSRALRMVHDGRILDAKSVSALLYFATFTR